MRMLPGLLSTAIVSVGVLVAVGAARAEHGSCEAMLLAKAHGQTDAQITDAFHTTHARLSACERILAKEQKVQERRARFEDAHDARFWHQAN